MKTNAIRDAFLNYFKQHHHTMVNSSPLVPGNDPTLLFTNAGMVQFKEVFLGEEQRSYTRACSSQRCVRAGGKHNDLENVGYTARHHTFFEMLGNFSFGDYFKKEAIEFAWNFLTEVLKLPKEKLWVTVFQDDQEAADIWLKEIGVDPNRFSYCGEKDNFWSMGDTGPCGPCTEIFYDHGASVAGGPPGSPNADGDRYIEIWNLVFMQFNRDASGKLTPLPKPSVDTGMGLERIAAVMQNVHSNYEIDLFQYLIMAIAKIVSCQDLHNQSLRVIADHIRACSFLICDGVMPTNEGRGYVLRRIIRRAIRHGHKLGMQKPFFYKVVQPLVDCMGDAYPELKANQANIEKILLNEENQFNKTLEQGLKILENDIIQLKNKQIPGATIFKLYDTYGFPVDLTNDIAREKGLTLDITGFDQAMQQQRAQSQANANFTLQQADKKNIPFECEFVGYEDLSTQSNVIAIYKDNQSVQKVVAGESASIILDVTPFYAEGGGQVGDQGSLQNAACQFKVENTTKINSAYLHHGMLQRGEVKVGDQLNAAIDQGKRIATMLNHSATHLLHAALRQILGSHVLQRGSLVAPNRLRFDFSHFEAVNLLQLNQIEQLVNQQIRKNHAVAINITTPADAEKSGAIALFGEKYGDQVRVLSMGDFSKELCGGTHVKHTGDIGLFKIILETGIAAGIRRIEAVTGDAAVQYVAEQDRLLQEIAQQLNTAKDQILDKLQQVAERAKKLEKQINQLNAKLSSEQGNDLVSEAVEIKGIHVLAKQITVNDPKQLRETLDQLKNKLKQAAIVLACEHDGKINLIAGVTEAQTSKISAKDLVNHVAVQVGGRGGGRADMAQAGGNDIAALPKALASVAPWLKERL